MLTALLAHPLRRTNFRDGLVSILFVLLSSDGADFLQAGDLLPQFWNLVSYVQRTRRLQEILHMNHVISKAL